MADFSWDDYLDRRFQRDGSTAPGIDYTAAPTTRAEYSELKQASREKSATLAEIRFMKDQELEANRRSLVGQLDLDPNGIAAFGVNIGASILDGVARVGGALASTPSTLYGVALEANIPEEAKQAAARLNPAPIPTDNPRVDLVKNPFQDSSAQDAKDRALLGLPSGDIRERERSRYAQIALDNARRNGTLETNADRIRKAQDAFATAKRIRDAFDISDVVQRDNQRQLIEDIRSGYQENTGQISEGWKNLKNGGVISGSADVVSGVAGLLATIGVGAVQNPKAATELIASNIPQIAAAAYGGWAGMAATNIPYAVSEFGKGVSEYQAKNGGALPPESQMLEMAAYAASLALAETVGDKLTIGSLGSVGKGAKAAAEGVDATVDASRKGLKDALFAAENAISKIPGSSIVAAGVKGAAGEFGTEAYQTFAENKIQGKDTTLEDAYVGGALGAISGGTLAGTLAVPAALVGSGTKDNKDSPQQQRKDELVNNSIATGDVSTFVDPKSPNYAPDKAVSALLGNANTASVTPEQKQANFEKATQIVADLEDRLAEVEGNLERTSEAGLRKQLDYFKQQLANTDPANTAQVQSLNEKIQMWEDDILDVRQNPRTKEATAYQKQLRTLKEQVNLARGTLGEFSVQMTKPADVDADIAAISTAVDPTNTDAVASSQAAVNRVINLSMASPEMVDTKTANALASNTGNALTDTQRSYFRAFSAARQAANLLRTTDKVSQEILFGSSENKGIEDYRRDMAAALVAKNQKLADKKLEQLTNFMRDQQAKEVATAQAWEQYQKTGKPVQVRTDGNRGWFIHTGAPLAQEQLTKEGSLQIDARSAKLVTAIANGSKAITAAATELQTAYEVAFNAVSPTMQGASNVTDVSLQPTAQVEQEPSVAEVDQAPQAGNTAEGQDTRGTKDAGGTVANEEQRVEAAAEPAAPTVVEEAPASSANTQETVATENTQSTQQTAESQNQSTENTTTTAEPTVPQTVATEDLAETIEQQAPAAETAAAVETAQPGVLGAVQERSEPGTAHADKKFGDFFTQVAGRDTDGSIRPLVAVANFMQAWANKTVKLSDYLKNVVTPTDAQRLALAIFARKAGEWAPLITRNLKPTHNAKFNYEDPMRYLIKTMTVDGKEVQDVEQNVKTAITAAIFAYVADAAGKIEINDDKAINSILGHSKDRPVTTDARTALEMVGTYQAQVVDSLGSSILDSLGFKLLKDAPQDMLAKLRVSLGGHALKLMEDQGIVQRTAINNATMKQLREEALFPEADFDLGLGLDAESQEVDVDDASVSARDGHVFFRLVRDTENAPVRNAKEIADALKGSQSIIQNLFGIESGLKYPSLEPAKGVQQKSDTGMGLPGLMKRLFKKNQSRPWKVNKDPMNVLGFFTEEEGMEMAGVSFTEEHTHKRNLNSKKAKNDGLIREFQNFMEFVGSQIVPSEKGLDQEFYLTQEMWKQQRSGYDNNTVNPNTSKIVRWLIAPDSWTTDISIDNAKQLQSFMLRVSEGFGIKPEKADSQVAVDALTALMADSLMVKAVKAMQAMLFDAEARPTAEQRDSIKAAVKQGGQKLHTMASLIAYARYQQALDTEAKTFTTNMMGEVDGVNNGSVLNQVLYGASATADAMNVLLEKGGIYTLASKFRQYNLWRGTPGHQDIYETNALDLNNYINTLPDKDRAIAAAIWETSGSPIKSAIEASKEGRDLLKGPINPLNYGGGFKSIIGKMSYDYVEKIYEKLEKFPAKDASQEVIDKFITDVNAILKFGDAKQIPVGRDIKFYLGYSMSKQQETALRNAYSATVGEAAKTVVEKNFNKFLERSKALNQTTNLTYALYEAVYNAEREAMLKELNIPVLKGEPVHDLTTEQEAELAKRLESILPVMNTAMSKEDGNIFNGILLSKKKRKQNSRNSYKVAVGFGTALRNGAKQLTVAGRSVVQDAPGVVAISGTTHALDSRISHKTQEERHVLNNHDALGDGVATLDQTAQGLNRNTWESLRDYSPLTEAHNALMRVVQGIVAMDQAGKLSPEAKENIKAAMSELASLSKTEPQIYIDLIASKIFSEALSADRTKYQGMSQWAVVDQYAMDGGSYEVTDADRQEVTNRLNDLVPVRSQSQVDALNALNATVFGSGVKQAVAGISEEQIQTVEAAFGGLGKSNVDSDSDLVRFFRQNPVATVAQVTQLLNASGRLNPINSKLLGLVFKTLSKVDPNLTIRYVTPDTDPSTLLELPQQPSRGWYIANKEGKTEIYVLSPEFKNSGLTSETLLHEMVHAAIARTIANPTKESKELVNELNLLLGAATKYVNQNRLTQYAAAISNVQELVAWGMTNQGFQREVLAKLEMRSMNGSNRLVSGMKKFIDTLTGLLLGRQNKGISNGLNVLVTNVSGLFYEAVETAQTSPPLNLSMAAMNAIDSYTTMDVYQALGQQQAQTALQPSFDTHLQEVLGTVVEKLHGAYGSFAAAMQKTQAANPLDAWMKAQATGLAPFASSVLGSGFEGSQQEVFVAEQVEATVRAALESGEPQTRAAYKELYKLYSEMEKKLTPADFGSQAEYDFFFKIEGGADGRSNYLARFAAFGLANQKFNKLMQVTTDRTVQPTGNITFTQRLLNIFEKVVNFFNEKLTHTYQGQQADEKLQVLVNQLVDIEAKRKAQLAANLNRTDFMAPIEEGARNLVEGAKNKIVDIAGSNFVRNNSFALVRVSGAAARTIAGNRVDQFLNGLQVFHDTYIKDRDSIVMSMLKEVTGHNELFQKMLRGTKNLERTRKQIITQNAEFSLNAFATDSANPKKKMSRETKRGITNVVMRTGMHNLMQDYTLAEMENLVGNPTAVAKEMAALEAKLPAAMRNRYIEQANILGNHLATGASHQWLMFNAYTIARMMGTQYEKRITEASAAAAENDIKKLITLYALKYTSMEDQQAAKQIFRTENARTDGGNGMQYVMGVHQAMEKASLDRLFNGNPVQMMHGYTPDIVNPYVTVVTATQDEGQTLLDQGYKMVSSLPLDEADQYAEPKFLYALHGVGLAPHVSGAMLQQTLGARGTNIHNGYTNPNTQDGLENAAYQATITNAKMKKLNSNKDPRRDLTKEDGNDLAPVYDDEGRVVNWRYLMKAKTKDNVLERNNDFDQVIGVLAGSVFDKMTVNDQNKLVIDALHQQFQKDFNTRREAYVQVGPNVADPELREVWALMSDQAKEDARKVFGKDGIWIRHDSLNIIFGYRKWSLSKMFKDSYNERMETGRALKDVKSINAVQRLTVGVVETVLANYAGYKLGMNPDEAERYSRRAAMVVAKGERMWQEIVSETKDIIVVKTGVVMLGNILSNVSLLMLSGMNLPEIAKHSLVAIKGATAYLRDEKELARLQTLVDMGYMQNDPKEIDRSILRLKDSLARNPVRELIEAGLMPTIAEDVSADEDIYSYKAGLAKKTERFTSKLNPNIVNIAKTVYMTHDTGLYQSLSRITQLSDFVGRYALYQHLTTRKTNSLSNEAAIQEASDYFVNYDIPMHKLIQYTDDMGLTMFTKYFLRIQKPLLKLAQENPARVLMAIMLDNTVGLGPIVLDSAFVHHIGNDLFRSGALQFPWTLDQLATLKAAFSLFK